MAMAEDDIWELFGGQSPDKPGKHDLAYSELHSRASRFDLGKSKTRLLQAPKLKKRDRLYRLRSSDTEAVVDQSRLFVTAKKFGDPELRVSYLGKAN